MVNAYFKKKTLKSRCLSHSLQKKKQEVLFVQRKIEKDSLWKLPSSISLSIYTVFWQSLSKEKLQGWDGYTWTTSAPAKELKHLQSILKLKTPFVLLIPLPWMDRKVLVWEIVPVTKDSIFLTYSKWLAPGISLLDNKHFYKCKKLNGNSAPSWPFILQMT